MNFHFIAGLPRSGSTLLAALLRQNPAIHTDVTSPIARLYAHVLLGMSHESEYGAMFNHAQRQQLLGGLFTSYYHGFSDKRLVFDNNRAWSSRLAGLAQLHPQAKLIACVRNPAWVVDSLERLVHSNPYELSALFGFDPEGTITTRAELVSGTAGLLGSALDGLKQACWGEHAQRLLLVRYETLVEQPASVIESIYEHIGERLFAHDFATVEFASQRLDQRLGTPNLHVVRKGVSFTPRRSVLPPELFESLEGLAFWETPAFADLGVHLL